jgi:hypothetical protein
MAPTLLSPESGTDYDWISTGKQELMAHSYCLDIRKAAMSAFSRLKSIPYTDPELTAENWCAVQPCAKIQFASKDIILTQPSSTFLVYALGLLTIGAGLYFLMIRDTEISRLWWGISLSLWGIGALLAGTSYQAFGYHLKCAGRQTCAWTSWWEVVYLIFQQVSMDAMLIAVAYSCTTGIVHTILVAYALVTAVVYTVVTLVGGLVPVKSLITFDLMVRVSTPMVLILLILNGWRYYTLGNSMDLVLLCTWILLLIISAAYCLYDDLDITRKLWADGEGIWFSQNDVLHIGLIVWMIYIAAMLPHRVGDCGAAILPG